ncbi:class I SAM-dependent methyltransferase [Aestuariivirga sp.]|uniref:class I SAM-dependent methyltransferase n=1 Tax=Aestuariivirga sp. TaxID=2650926 RepID=UPI00391B2660
METKQYWRCEGCEATFLDPHLLPSEEEEFSHYLQHENDAGDSHYRAFLSRVSVPLLMRLKPASRGLDFGCGPGPALAAMLEEAGHRVALYDPFFYPDRAGLQPGFDFIACTETAEHFHRPAEEFDLLDGLLQPGGWLALMTCIQTEDARFASWHYRSDPTHVVFYRENTLAVISAQRGWDIERVSKDVFMMRKKGKHPR